MARVFTAGSTDADLVRAPCRQHFSCVHSEYGEKH